MCLTITIRASGVHAETRRQLEVRFPELLDRRTGKDAVYLHACELLSEEADWNSPTWTLTADGRKTLSVAINAIFADAAGPIEFEALWEGDRADTEQTVSRSDLLSLVDADGLGTKTRYHVGR
jgi:hypothetical protein